MLGSEDAVVAFFVVQDYSAVGMGDKKEGRGSRDPANGGAGRTGYATLFVETGITGGYGIWETMNLLCGRDRRRDQDKPSQTISPVLNPMMMSRWSPDAVTGLMSWQVGHAENDTLARGSC